MVSKEEECATDYNLFRDMSGSLAYCDSGLKEKIHAFFFFLHL